MTPSIRLATPGDIPAILAISNWAAEHTAANFALAPEPLASWQESYRTTHEVFPWLVAEDAGVVVGFAKASPWKGRCAYDYTAEITVYVHPDHHGRGLGKALYGRLLDTMRAQGFRSVLGGIALPNDASVRLHESLGMTQVARLRSVGWKFGCWHDVGYWQVVLQDEDAPAPKRLRPVAEVVGGS